MRVNVNFDTDKDKDAESSFYSSFRNAIRKENIFEEYRVVKDEIDKWVDEAPKELFETDRSNLFALEDQVNDIIDTVMVERLYNAFLKEIGEE